jgi:hypothetical protein
MGARQPCQGCLDTSAARPMSRGRGSGLPTWMPQATSRRVEPGEWPERQPGGDPGQQRFDGAGTREVEEEPGLVVLALRRHFAAGEAHGRGLGRGQRGLWERRGPAGLRQAIGGPRPQEPPGGREAGRRRGAVAGEVTLERLDLVFAGPPRAVARFLPPRRRGGRQGGDAKAGGVASRPHCRLEDAPPGLGPGGGARGKLGLETAAVGRARGMGLRAGGPRRGQTPRLRQDGGGVAPQDRLAGQAAADSDPGPMGAPREHRRGGTRAVPTDQARGPGPGTTPEGEAPPHEPRVRRAGGPRARAEAGRHQRAGESCAEHQRHRAIMLRIMVVACERLRSVGRLVGVIKLEHDGRRRRRGAGAAGGASRLGQPREVLTVHALVKPRAGRRTRQVLRGSPWEALHPQLQPRGSTEAVGVMASRRAGGALRETLGPEVAPWVSQVGGRACSVDGGRAACGEAHLALDAAEEEDTTIRGPGASLAIGPAGMASQGMKSQWFWRRIGHGQTSSNLYGIDRSQVLC